MFHVCGQPLQHGEVRDTNLAWVRHVHKAYLRVMKRIEFFFSLSRCYNTVQGYIQHRTDQIDGFVQDCSNSSALAMESL